MTVSFYVKGWEVLVDEIDADLAGYRWKTEFMNGLSVPYLSRWIGRVNGVCKTVSPHRTVMARMIGRPLLRSEIVDHCDLNPLNNQRSNLRLATQSQNRANARAGKNNVLGVKGVSKVKNRYKAQIKVQKKSIYLGSFLTLEEAHTAYITAAKKYFGEFARSK